MLYNGIVDLVIFPISTPGTFGYYLFEKVGKVNTLNWLATPKWVDIALSRWAVRSRLF